MPETPLHRLRPGYGPLRFKNLNSRFWLIAAVSKAIATPEAGRYSDGSLKTSAVPR